VNRVPRSLTHRGDWRMVPLLMRLATTCLLVILIAACRVTRGQPSPVALTPDQVDVVAAALEVHAANPYARPCVVPDLTNVFSGVGSQLVSLIPKSATPQRMVFARATDVNRLFTGRRGGWHRFYSQFPNTPCLLRVSAPEIGNGTASLILELRSGMECCGAEEMHFSRTSLGWKLTTRRTLWMF
jgi:hypothetical protein